MKFGEGGGVLEKFHFCFKRPSEQALTKWSSSDQDYCTAVVFVSPSTHCWPCWPGSFGNWFLSLHQWPRKLIIVAPSSQSSNGLTHTHIQIQIQIQIQVSRNTNTKHQFLICQLNIPLQFICWQRSVAFCCNGIEKCLSLQIVVVHYLCGWQRSFACDYNGIEKCLSQQICLITLHFLRNWTARQNIEFLDSMQSMQCWNIFAETSLNG